MTSWLSLVSIAECGVKKRRRGLIGEGASWADRERGDSSVVSHRRRQTVDAQNGPANIVSNLVMRCVEFSAVKKAKAFGKGRTYRRQNGRSNR
ncbi:hypothetical protein L3X38_033877 [Prunus dulcis]|uniref:Uncharacterized protein n=1 Tax=Prunus dulcis TaxID=3755 RepID=A0AAD4YXC5_PRUDU|nr:hypothetical protein L3X38_033877 [Prunus dulcis]